MPNKYCPECGTKLIENDNFCSSCGVAQHSNQSTKEQLGMPKDFSQEKIQEILDKHMTDDDADGYFIYRISEMENIYVQGYQNHQSGEFHLELTGKNILTNPDILDTEKFKKLIALGWKNPRGKENINFNRESSTQDWLDGKMAKFLYDSLRIFDLSADQIDVQYEFGSF